MSRKRRKGRKSERAPGAAAGVTAPTARSIVRPDWIAFLTIVGLAAAVRLAYTFASRQSPFFDHLDLDSRFYDLWAKRIAGGDWIGDEVFFMGPLYPYFLAVVYRVFGPDLVAVKIIQGILGSLTAGVTFLLGKELFGKVAGLVAGFIAALYVPFIFYDNSILFPVLATLLNTLMLYFLCTGVVRNRGVPFLAAGIFAGLSAAGNASVLAFAPLAVAFILASHTSPFKARFRKAAYLGIGVAIIVMPITIRNIVVGGDFVPLTSNAGLNLFIGNNEESTGAYVKPGELDVYTDPEGKSIAEAALGRSLKPSEVSAYWTDRALSFIRRNPGGFLYNLARKAFFFWSVYEVPQIEHLPFEKRYSWLLRIPSPSFGIVCPLGILGILLALRRRKETWLLVLFMLAYSFTIITFFVVARYRLPMLPALMVFASYTVSWWISAAARRRRRDMALSVAGFIALFTLVHTNFYRIDPKSGFAQSFYRLGIVQERKGNITEAMENYREAVREDPDLTQAHLNLGILLSREGQYEEARAELRQAIELKPDYAKAHYNLGLVYSEEARNDSALKMMEKALELDQDYDLAMLGKASILYEMARFDAAESVLVALRREPSLTEQATQQIDMLLKVLPDRRRWVVSRPSRSQRLSDGYLLRGDNLLALGLTDRALRTYQLAIRTDSTAAIALFQAGTIYSNRGASERALTLFDLAARAAPGLRGVHLAKGVIAYRMGDIEGACREFGEELGLDPGSSAAHINLAMCYEEHLGDLRRAAFHIRKYVELTGGTHELLDHLKELEKRIRDEAE